MTSKTFSTRALLAAATAFAVLPVMDAAAALHVPTTPKRPAVVTDTGIYGHTNQDDLGPLGHTNQEGLPPKKTRTPTTPPAGQGTAPAGGGPGSGWDIKVVEAIKALSKQRPLGGGLPGMPGVPGEDGAVAPDPIGGEVIRLEPVRDTWSIDTRVSIPAPPPSEAPAGAIVGPDLPTIAPQTGIGVLSSPVPGPATLPLIGLGALALAGRRRRR